MQLQPFDRVISIIEHHAREKNLDVDPFDIKNSAVCKYINNKKEFKMLVTFCSGESKLLKTINN